MVSKCQRMEVDQVGGGTTSNSKNQVGGGTTSNSDKHYRSQLKLNVSNSRGGWHGGKRSPPKISPQALSTPARKNAGSYRSLLGRVGRTSTSKSKVNTPDRSQSSIKEFLVGSPRNVKTDSRAHNKRTEMDAEQKEF